MFELEGMIFYFYYVHRLYCIVRVQTTPLTTEYFLYLIIHHQEGQRPEGIQHMQQHLPYSCVWFPGIITRRHGQRHRKQETGMERLGGR